MKFSTIVVFGLLSIFLVSCATGLHKVMKGTVVMKMGEDLAHVCMGNDEVQAGDKLIVYKHNCKSTDQGYKTRGDLNVICNKERMGEGTVIAILNEHYSEVRFDPGVPFAEGSTVEKK